MTASAAPARRVHVEHCMGTAFTIDIRDPGAWDEAIGDVVAWLHHVDTVFSTYRPTSDICRIQSRELRLADADPDVALVLDLCADVQMTTAGAFTATPNGRLDPTGLVKGWAVERASRLLRAHGAANHAVNGGGDMQLAGGAAPDRPWTVGIADPHRPRRIVTTVVGRDIAIATSGTAERGPHIVDPFTARPATAIASATVVGPSLTYADAYATAAFVMGRDAPRWVDGIEGYAALILDQGGAAHHSSAWPFLAAAGMARVRASVAVLPTPPYSSCV
jgi:FAD:protein FMN transferase